MKGKYLSLGVFAVVFLIIGLIAFLIGNSLVVSYKTEIPQIEKDIVVCQENYEEVNKIIEKFVKCYPMEKELYDNFHKLNFLLKLPEIKSDVLLAKQINTLTDLKSEIASLKCKINTNKQALEWHEKMGFWLYFRVVSTKI
jgi:hypothetical protein